jgi:hypothetical protein
MSGSNAVHLTRISDNLQPKYTETISLGKVVAALCPDIPRQVSKKSCERKNQTLMQDANHGHNKVEASRTWLTMLWWKTVKWNWGNAAVIVALCLVALLVWLYA